MYKSKHIPLNDTNFHKIMTKFEVKNVIYKIQTEIRYTNVNA